MPETELAWAAGFFDGEGWFSATDRHLEMGVGQKERTTLERFRRAVGVGTLYEERGNTFSTWRATNAADQLTAIRRLWPYLSGPKRASGRAAIERVIESRESMTRSVRAVDAAYAEMREEVGRELAVHPTR